MECPHIRRKYNTDQCKFNGKVCLLETGNECEVYNDIKEEEK